MTSPQDNLILVGFTMKPYGLLGEMRVKPASFDPERHASLEKVYFKKRDEEEPQALEVRSSRADGDNWYLKFKGLKTPEAVAHLSGGKIFVAEADALELPEDMVYVSDVPGMKVIDENGEDLGTVAKVLEQGAQEILVVRVTAKAKNRELLVPWNDHFVKRIEKEARLVRVDISSLRGLL